MRSFKHLTWNDRLEIEKMLKEAVVKGKRVTQAAIARRIGKTRQAVSLELKRAPQCTREYGNQGKMMRLYSPEMAQARYEGLMEYKGCGLKIGNDMILANFLRDRILNDKHIEKGFLPDIELRDLPYRRKRKKRKVLRRAARLPKGPSIEKRPEHIDGRAEVGHWEMDTVHGDNRRFGCL